MLKFLKNMRLRFDDDVRKKNFRYFLYELVRCFINGFSTGGLKYGLGNTTCELRRGRSFECYGYQDNIWDRILFSFAVFMMDPFGKFLYRSIQWETSWSDMNEGQWLRHPLWFVRNKAKDIKYKIENKIRIRPYRKNLYKELYPIPKLWKIGIEFICLLLFDRKAIRRAKRAYLQCYWLKEKQARNTMELWVLLENVINSKNENLIKQTSNELNKSKELEKKWQNLIDNYAYKEFFWAVKL